MHIKKKNKVSTYFKKRRKMQEEEMSSSKPPAPSSQTPMFPANIGSVTQNSYWVTLFEDQKCKYYDLNIEEANGSPKYIADASKRKYTRFKYIDNLGGGGGGLALKVWDSDENPIVLKIALDSFMSEQERTAGAFINRWLLAGRRCPNFVASLFELVCRGLPPAKHDWKDIVEFIQREWVPRFIIGASEPYYRKGAPAISYLGLEFGTSGDLFSFGEKYLGHDMIASLSFQILFGLAALHETNFVHKDVQDQNIVISEFNPRANSPPLYRIRLYEDVEWIYGDPYLINFNKTSKIGEELHLFYTAKFIDYGGSLRVSAKFPNVVFMEGMSGVIQSASPEALFIDRKPLELLLPTEQWKKQKHPMVPYSKATDVWAAGMVICTLALGANLFMESEDAGITWLYPAPKKVINGMKLIYNNSRWMKKYAQVSMNNAIQLMWNMVEALGLPTNRSWPGIEHSSLFRVILKYRHFLRHGTTGGWIKGDEEGPPREAKTQERLKIIADVLGYQGFSMLFDHILVWNSTDRGKAALLVTHHNFFKHIRDAGQMRHEIYGDDENTWGFEQKWWIQHEAKAKINKKKKKKSKPKKKKKSKHKKKKKSKD